MRLAKVIHSITLHTYMYVSNCAEGAKYKALVRVEIHVRKVIRNIPVYFTAPHMVQWLLKKKLLEEPSKTCASNRDAPGANPEYRRYPGIVYSYVGSRRDREVLSR